MTDEFYTIICLGILALMGACCGLALLVEFFKFLILLQKKLPQGLDNSKLLWYNLIRKGGKE